ncbi:MAG: PP2C family protein-serine/threonine phosphatase [Omnitrophica WOR_2 bacterium]
MNSDGIIHNSEERLALLYHLSQTFNSSLDLSEVLNRVMDEVIAVTHAERGFVMLKQGDDRGGQLEFRVARGLDQKTLEDPQFQISRSIVERVAGDGKPILTSDAQADERFNIRQSVMFLGLRSILCVPLNVKDRIIGVIYVDNRWQSGLFTQADLELLSAIASSAGIALENARLYEVAIEKGRMERELQMARKVQYSLLPHETPDIPGWNFAGRWKPAREVGGDYYDFIRMKAPYLGLVIADVTDKGMPAALFMASTRSIIRATMTEKTSPLEGITHANQLLCAEANDNLFVTLFYAQLNVQTGELVYVNAGHNPPIFFSFQTVTGNHLSPLMYTGMQLGVELGTEYHQKTIHIDPGDFLVLYTDGVTESMDVNNQEYGMERLQGVILDNKEKTPEGILSAILQDIESFTGGMPPSDDITLVVGKRL